MVRISVSETYDLSTKTGKMSLIGVHTPDIAIVQRQYGGILSNVKFIRYHHCDVKLACASILPADPLQVGVESGDIAPQDMFNPILYKAVSNQAMNEFELRMHGIRDDNSTYAPHFHGMSLDKSDSVTNQTDEFDIYYSLLSNRKGWKVAHPQRGLHMSNLRPFVYERLFNQGDEPYSASIGMGDSAEISTNSSGQLVYHTGRLTAVRGRPRPLPALPAHTLTNISNQSHTPAYGTASQLDQVPTNKDMSIYCGLIVMPPAKLNVFYYRLVVRWFIDLIGVRPYNEIETFGVQGASASYHYGSDYFPITSKSENQMGMVDIESGDIEKIMEGR